MDHAITAAAWGWIPAARHVFNLAHVGVQSGESKLVGDGIGDLPSAFVSTRDSYTDMHMDSSSLDTRDAHVVQADRCR
jgi:hypothetical protein